MPKSYPREFRRKVLDLIASGCRVAQVTADLDISEQCIYLWRPVPDRHRSGPWRDEHRSRRVGRRKCKPSLARPNTASSASNDRLRGSIAFRLRPRRRHSLFAA
jgi:Transposase